MKGKWKENVTGIFLFFIFIDEVYKYCEGKELNM